MTGTAQEIKGRGKEAPTYTAPARARCARAGRRKERTSGQPPRDEQRPGRWGPRAAIKTNAETPARGRKTPMGRRKRGRTEARVFACARPPPPIRGHCLPRESRGHYPKGRETGAREEHARARGAAHRSGRANGQTNTRRNGRSKKQEAGNAGRGKHGRSGAGRDAGKDERARRRCRRGQHFTPTRRSGAAQASLKWPRLVVPVPLLFHDDIDGGAPVG